MRVFVDDLLSTLLGNIVAGTAIAIAFGAAQTRCVMIKPSIVHFAFAAAMLWRGWMGRYLPPIVTDHAMKRTKTRQPGARRGGSTLVRLRASVGSSGARVIVLTGDPQLQWSARPFGEPHRGSRPSRKKDTHDIRGRVRGKAWTWSKGAQRHVLNHRQRAELCSHEKPRIHPNALRVDGGCCD